jgi:hypothetical protein
MTESSEFYTATMARLYAEQGYLLKAAEIYRYLAAQDSKDAELKRALEDIEQEIIRRQAPTLRDAQLLLREWIDLLREKKKRERTV